VLSPVDRGRIRGRVVARFGFPSVVPQLRFFPFGRLRVRMTKVPAHPRYQRWGAQPPRPPASAQVVSGSERTRCAPGRVAMRSTLGRRHDANLVPPRPTPPEILPLRRAQGQNEKGGGPPIPINILKGAAPLESLLRPPGVLWLLWRRACRWIGGGRVRGGSRFYQELWAFGLYV